MLTYKKNHSPDVILKAGVSWEVFDQGCFVGTVSKTHKNWFATPSLSRLKDGRKSTDAVYPTRQLAAEIMAANDRHMRNTGVSTL